ncbi:MAG: 50S ribosomal protein L18 [Gammaproteobacteria bacterium]|nr:50S ribosomal protein L18 [Gammaproteobacteria bacterium]
MKKKIARLRRARRSRMHMREIGATRLTVHRTPRHIYAQVISPEGDRVVAAAATVEKDVRTECANGGNVAAAALVGRLIAERAKAAGVETVAFDRSGFKFHGRIKALADAAREHGLQF